MSEPVTCPICGRPAVEVHSTEWAAPQTHALQHITCVFEVLGRRCETCDYWQPNAKYSADGMDCFHEPEVSVGGTIPSQPFSCMYWEPKP